MLIGNRILNLSGLLITRSHLTTSL